MSIYAQETSVSDVAMADSLAKNMAKKMNRRGKKRNLKETDSVPEKRSPDNSNSEDEEGNDVTGREEFKRRVQELLGEDD